jgi:hypothetical protein
MQSKKQGLLSISFETGISDGKKQGTILKYEV